MAVASFERVEQTFLAPDLARGQSRSKIFHLEAWGAFTVIFSREFGGLVQHVRSVMFFTGRLTRPHEDIRSKHAELFGAGAFGFPHIRYPVRPDRNFRIGSFKWSAQYSSL
jgi:hypothetical protein